jgi:methylmalonyl-CoA mutase cobalamin-binding subunit
MSACFSGWTIRRSSTGWNATTVDVIGLSCSGDHSVNALERLMIALRKRRKDARIILSGQIASDADALARLPRPMPS